ncbi:Methyltransferase type 12 OS=Granulicella tundricola (strain ATCC BAA-1859 / DSM 23138 / MP5ACTX9) GN=AciX9_0971 PE=4 SV=1: Methyltransf_18 [Tuwongella immobilis]|uniref:Methyltransferase domain-containing protein n=2 Tax=Tuwongella immobilis TaxID=692036 RepID=A0A6C2YRF0_9BACT|nr:Methyltransferase type 12 OS=Granulicella tundricola (strain ATCC BAA-1859 / DSM 23138 / MP5ACTX9) GN=AciX9_0971 PE=4 SV=1: Methyltransf_18 [Tuwongella immobilis]VTS04498.1 Methyltransferase type 12 OS=Granulicella tundricola (strain ATCC BAA-1859 / DSM 23138 / MP5ACTX9) GN=AciX9_0971 PE=4 SV=1: Methyltransf_18 [Tuwongella immobilis]
MRRPQFDRLAPMYATLERITYGSLLQRCRIEWLPTVSHARSALLVGDGDGRFLAELLRSNPEICVDSIDVSQGMLSLARKRIDAIRGAPDRVRFHQQDLREWNPDRADYDLIVTHFLLDCFPESELAWVMAKLDACTRPDAVWLSSDFAIPPGGWHRPLAQLTMGAMYLAFRAVTNLPASRWVDPTPTFVALGWGPPRVQSWLGGFLRAERWTRCDGTASLPNAAADSPVDHF